MMGFTKLSKGLSGVLFLGYLVPLLLPWTISYLALVPAKTIPFVWNIITAGYMEQSVLGLVVSISGLLFSGKLLEPVWTSREFLKFIIFINTCTLAGVYVTAVTSYYIMRREALLYLPLSGFHGVIAGFLVGVKQVMPDQEITALGGYTLRAKWLPSLLVLMSLILSLFTSKAMPYLPFVMFGTYSSWLYIRYLQRNPETNSIGNPGNDFAFYTFFPPLIRRHPPRRGDDDISDSISFPGLDSAEASRWREKGACALGERLQDASKTYSSREGHLSIIV